MICSSAEVSLFFAKMVQLLKGSKDSGSNPAEISGALCFTKSQHRKLDPILKQHSHATDNVAPSAYRWQYWSQIKG